MKFACRGYFSSMSTENDSSSSFFTTSALERLRKRIRMNNMKKNTFFHFSVKDLVKFSKNSNDTGPT